MFSKKRTTFPDLRSFLDALRERGELREIHVPVDPYLEVAEIHRRVVEDGGPALFFRNVRGSSFPVVTNLFGTKSRVELAFGNEARRFIEKVATLPRELFPPTLEKLWAQKELVTKFLSLGTKISSRSSSLRVVHSPPALDRLPVLTTWKEDGGPFVTLPLVYTEHPETKLHNLGMYRLQRHSPETTGLHCQIAKGGGFHLARAKELGQKLPVNVFIGGPPACILAAISPLPENAPELLFASLVLGEKLKLAENPYGPLPLLEEAEFVLVGECDPNEMKPEGPFGDHYGYYSLRHDYPVFRCKTLLHRENAIYPATVVGKPRQEDFFIGDYLQETLSPLFPLVMPGVKKLWSYGETGYHSLAAAVVSERYKREAMVSGFRILGEGQLSLTKFLLLVDRPLDLTDFRSVLEYVLERVDFRTDLYVFSNLSMDTLDYTGPKINEGSKGIMLGMGNPVRTLPGDFSGDLPPGCRSAKVFSRGCLVLGGPSYREEPDLAKSVSTSSSLAEWPLVILADDTEKATANTAAFLWTVFTRFEPAGDIFAKSVELHRFHPSLHAPIVIDARMKPNYPAELECDEQTKRLVDSRWGEYFC